MAWRGVAWPVFAQRLWGSNLKRTKNEKMDFEENEADERTDSLGAISLARSLASCDQNF